MWNNCFALQTPLSHCSLLDYQSLPKTSFFLATNAYEEKPGVGFPTSSHLPPTSPTPTTEVHYFWSEAERAVWLTNGTFLKNKYILTQDSLPQLGITLLTIKTPFYLYLISLKYKYLSKACQSCSQRAYSSSCNLYALHFS